MAGVCLPLKALNLQLISGRLFIAKLLVRASVPSLPAAAHGQHSSIPKAASLSPGPLARLLVGLMALPSLLPLLVRNPFLIPAQDRQPPRIGLDRPGQARPEQGAVGTLPQRGRWPGPPLYLVYLSLYIIAAQHASRSDGPTNPRWGPLGERTLCLCLHDTI